MAAAHLRHEWILTLCLVIALAAVIAPLLVLLGLKHGTIETLRDRLVEDPVYREIRPARTQEYQPEWFDGVQAWPGVGFMTPTILPLSSVLQVRQAGGRAGWDMFDLVPTASGDPLLVENGARVPLDGQAVLTSEAARQLGGVVPGAMIEGRVTRSRGGRVESGEIHLKVVDVLPPRAGSLPRVYAPLEFVLDVEAFREGYGAPARRWPGTTPEPFVSLDGAILLLTEPLPPIERTGLIINTGFGRLEEVDGPAMEERLGWKPQGDWHAYAVYSPATAVTLANIRALEQKLRGRDRILLPYVSGVRLNVEGTELTPIGLSLDTAQAHRLGLPAPPWGGFTGRVAEGAGVNLVLAGGSWPERIMVSSVGGRASLEFDLVNLGASPFEQPVVPIELLGVLRTGEQRGLQFDPDGGRLLMLRGGYRGFRMYAKSIDDVPQLYQRLRAQGIEVIAEVEAIQRIQVLDAGLNRLFWLIAILGFSGGVAVLVASLYAAVERRRRDLGVLRLVGFARRHVFFFPIVQGVIIAALGLGAGLAGYAVLAATINRVFAADLAAGEQFCTLPPDYVAIAVVTTLLLAVAASLVAAWRATHVDPAEAIREQ